MTPQIARAARIKHKLLVYQSTWPRGAITA